MKTVSSVLIVSFLLATPAMASTSAKEGETPVALTSAPAQSEAEIPVQLEKQARAGEADGTLFRLLFGFAIIGVLGAGGYIFLRRYSRPGPMRNAPQIKILTQHWLGPKKSLAIVRVAGESILVGITEQNISMIKALSLLDEEVPDETPRNFDQAIKSAEMKGRDDDEEEFSVGGLREIVGQRLKNMRSLE